jgi:hypothetical protein
MGIEDAFQDCFAQRSAQIKASLEVAVQEIFPLENDERPASTLYQSGDRVVDNFGASKGLCDESPFSEKSPGGKALKKPPDIFLKYNDQGDGQDGEEPLEGVFGQVQVKNPGGGIYSRENEHPDEDEARRGFFKPYQGDVYEYGYDGDIQKIENAYALKELDEIVFHGTLL